MGNKTSIEPIDVVHEIILNQKITSALLNYNQSSRVAYLNNEQYLVQYTKNCVCIQQLRRYYVGYKVVDIKKKVIQELDITNQYSIPTHDLKRLGEKSFGINSTKTWKLMRFKMNEKRNIYQKVDQINEERLICLHQSGLVLQVNGQGIKFFDTQEMIIQFQRKQPEEGRSQQYHGTIDQQKEIIYDKGKDWIKTINIITKKVSKIDIPSQFNSTELKGKITYNIYFAEQTLAIVAPPHQLQQFQFQKKQQKTQPFTIYSYDTTQKITTCLMKQTSVQGKFITINKPLSILVYLTSSLVYFNYKKKQIVGKFFISLLGFETIFSYQDYLYKNDLTQRLSPDLKQIVSFQQAREQTILQVTGLIETKKYYFHLIKKSYLWTNYGEAMAKKLFNILEIPKFKQNQSQNVMIRQYIPFY